MQLGMAAPRAMRLNADAVPTIFKHTEARAAKRRLHTEQRIAKLDQKRKRTVCDFLFSSDWC